MWCLRNIRPNRLDDKPISIRPVCVPLSAKDEPGLKRVVQQISRFIRKNPLATEDFAYTLQVGREALRRAWRSRRGR